jgi:hypothetical protein
MGSRQRAVMSLSLPPDTAKEYKEIAKTEGKTISGLFRDMFSFYKREKLKKEFYLLQDYGRAEMQNRHGFWLLKARSTFIHPCPS